MKHLQSSGTLLTVALTAVGLSAAAILIAGLAFTVAPQGAQASPAITQKTGEPCTKCHTKPPALTAYGQKYKSGKK